MKVVLFCGGMGLRMRDYSEVIPKPMAQIGYRPILWHVMKYYAYYGHTDFILCLGYRADVIKNYFLNYSEYLSNEFIMSKGGKQVQLLQSDIENWNITFVDTGLNANIGQRLKAVEPYLDGEELFLANYSDGLTDLPISHMVDLAKQRQTIATFLCVRPPQTSHIVALHDDGSAAVKSIQHIGQSGLWINGGFFVFRREIFDYIQPGEELVETPFRRLIAEQQLTAYKYDGFWACMDTFKDRQQLDEMCSRGDAPWEIWKTARGQACLG
jgi:glucose-1-phosphate cytidylyltransferase